MLKKLRIQNFKGWQDTGEIEMAPLTLFFGANSSGKSSIGQFLMMLKQTVESPDRKAVLYPGGKNSAVQLGSFHDMVYKRDLKNKIQFDYCWTLPETFSGSYPYKTDKGESVMQFAGNELAFHAEIGMAAEALSSLALSKFYYELLEDDSAQLTVGMKRHEEKAKYKFDASPHEPKRTQGRPWPFDAPVRFYGFPDEVVAYHQQAEFVQELNLRHEKLFNSLCYLGPLRIKPDRLYTWSGVEPESVGYAGENSIAAILAASDREISMGKRQKFYPLKATIAQKLKEMGLIESFEVEAISEKRREYEVKVRPKGAPNLVDLPDVGFGISQVLPVLVQCFYAPVGSIIIMEQPEIHLHPSAQSALADVMIDVINSKERRNGKGSEDRNIQLIIETHSEHFLRRLQRRIAEGKITQDSVSAYFANVNKAQATLDSLQIDEYGNIQNWPENFFGDEMGDISAQALAGIEKRSRENKAKQEVSE
ncbi:MAG: DUF3696 domain-containing protein [Lentisphaerae bacterium]|nr:DUF3696 domain-containing protein [Lentisphaerota bacterium]OQC16766.1 MAG: hypothetical protein BWX73_00679 [Lentisphaerae bacterium ADurb.Bin082]HQL86386.1 DUF3696 domain-containing protein [Lentisphaeria bacterium]